MTKPDDRLAVVSGMAARVVCLLLLAMGSCSSDSSGDNPGGPLVRLHLSPVDPATAKANLKVTVLNPAGQEQPFAMEFSSGPFDLLGVSFPIGTRGPTQYEVTLSNGDGCPLASGAASLTLDDDTVYELPVAMKPVPLCGDGVTVTVQLANVVGGQGKVTSTPPGIDCSGGTSGCSAVFNKGTQITLAATPSLGSFTGWSSTSCTGTAPCLLTLSQDVSVQAVFTACHGWCTEPLGLTVTANLNAITGTAVDHILIVGDGGTALLWDGMKWQKQPPLTVTANLRAAAGKLGGSVISVGGDRGTILQLTGTTWTQITNSSQTNIRGATLGLGSTPNVFFVGEGGNTFRLSPTGALTGKGAGTLLNIHTIAQNPNAGGDDLILGGSSFLSPPLADSWDGNNSFKSQMTGSSARLSGNINAMICGKATFYAAGDQGGLVSRASGKGAADIPDKWVAVTSSTSKTLRGMWENSDNEVFAVGDNGTIIQYNGAAWSTVAPITANNLRAIWGSSPANIYAVGEGGVVLHYLP